VRSAVLKSENLLLASERDARQVTINFIRRQQGMPERILNP